MSENTDVAVAEPYPYSPITSRAPLSLPGGAGVAVYVGLNIERFRPELPVLGDGPVPDPLAYGWRDYGNRVGFWRLLDVFDALALPVTGIVNSDVAVAFPGIVQAGIERGWAWVAHGQTNSVPLSGMTSEIESEHLDQMLAVLDDALPARPTGWLGPGLSETARTPGLLAERGFRYVLDWCSDDQPFPLHQPGLLSVPYSLELNDFTMFQTGPGLTGADYERAVLDVFEQLVHDSASATRVMALPLHTFITGQPHRTKYLARALREIVASNEAWICTADDVAALPLTVEPGAP